VDFCSGKSQRHAFPTVNADFASKDPARYSRPHKLHVMLQRPCSEVCVP